MRHEVTTVYGAELRHKWHKWKTKVRGKQSENEAIKLSLFIENIIDDGRLLFTIN